MPISICLSCKGLLVLQCWRWGDENVLHLLRCDLSVRAGPQAVLRPRGHCSLSLIIWGFQDLSMIAMIGTSDQPCWRTEACKPLLLNQPQTCTVMKPSRSSDTNINHVSKCYMFPEQTKSSTPERHWRL